ncbi:uncharacterized protein LOC119732430 isoform X2 [Patiria miniata]|uniref:Insulin receptor substrate 1 n=1 Tax=Patiria miniata TaxID=46514 RepID=A0A914ADR1_PATMI|nr:uncharacterized protein LOC119732430 isoform X2 [Patiria miniata]
MADHTNPLLQCSLKIRRGRKWKTRWCELTKLSPVSDQIVLKFYKGQDQLLSGKEIRREQIVLSAQNFCGVESCVRHPKNPFVLTIICLDQIVLLSFACHKDLLTWFEKTYVTLGNATKFKCTVEVPNGGRLRPGPGLLYFHDNHFAITDEVPSRLIGSWSLANLSRYGIIEEGFAFEVRSTSKDGGAFVVITQHAESLKSHFDAATCSPSSNRWSHVSSTVSIHEELAPRRRDFSEEMRCLLASSRNNDHQSGGNSPGGTYPYPSGTNPTQVRSPAMLEHCSNRRNQLQRNQALGGRFIEMIEMDQSWGVGGGSSGSSSGSSVETIFNTCDGLRSPKKTTPIREQNYEVMASFNHLREAEDSSNGNAPHIGDLHEACAICQGGKKSQSGDSEREEHEYVNLPPPKNGKRSNQQGPTDGENLNRSHVHVPALETKLEKAEKQTPTFASNSAHARSMSLPLNEDYLLMKYHESENSKPAASKTGKTRSLSVQPSMERSDNLPAPFDDLLPASTLQGMLEDLPNTGKRSRNRSTSRDIQSDIPVPFHHGDLVKPVGPIAMLRLNSVSSSSSESVSSASESLLDAQISRGASFSRPRQSSVGASYQRGFAKIHSRSHDERSSSPPVDVATMKFPSRKSDPDFQRMLGQRDEDSETFVYARKGSIERRPESPISSAPSVTSYITRRRQSFQRAENSLDETKGRSLEDKSTMNVQRRKRCNTDPSVVFTTPGDGTAWCRDPKDDEDAEGDGYLIMKPVYEEKLKRFQSRQQSSPVIQAMPQSPLHSGEKTSFLQSKLKRSATVSGEVSALSPTRFSQRTMSLRERPARTAATPPRDRKSSMSFMDRFLRKRGGSEGAVKLDISRPRHKHNYASIDPENVARRASLKSRMESIDNPVEVDILDDEEFSESLNQFMTENPRSLADNSGTSSAPSSIQYNQIEANRRQSMGQDTGINFTADVDAVVFSEDRKVESSNEYLNL